MNVPVKFIFTFSLIFLSNIVQAALTTGLVNDFQNDSVEGWIHQRIHANSPVNTTNDGPAGSGDNSLRISAHGGDGAGSRLLAINRSAPWTGAVSPDVTGLELDLKHINASDLSIRIAVGDSTGPGGTWYSSSTAYSLATSNSGNWEHATFSFSDFALVSGTADLSSVLNNIAEIRILHSLANDFRGDKLNGVFAVDNISVIPIPGAIWLFASGLGLLGLHRNR